MQVGKPILNALEVSGPGIDALTSSTFPDERLSDLIFSACAPSSDDMTDLTAASGLPLVQLRSPLSVEGAPAELADVYATHCYLEGGAKMTLAFKVSIGASLLFRLHFVEPYAQRPQQRVLSIYANGVIQARLLPL